MNKTRKTWTSEDESKLKEALSGCKNHSYAFITVAQSTGHSVKAVSQHYYKMKNKTSVQEDSQVEAKTAKKWTPEEDAVLTRYVRAGVTNLHTCFIAVAEQLGRTPTAVAAHWYSVLSKKDLIFTTISEQHVTKNRKNGKGVPSTSSIWRKVLRIISGLFK